MDENSYINKDYPVYFSYAGNKDGNSELEKPIEELRKLLCEANIDYRDYKVEGKTPFTYRRPMMESEEEIGSGHLIVVVLSISYIESSHCMYEWYNIVHNPDFEKRFFPIYLEDLRERLNDPVRTEMLDVILSKMYKEIALKEANSSVLSNEEKFILHLGDKAFKNELGEIISYYRNNSVPKLDRFDYKTLLEQIRARIEELEPSKMESSRASSHKVGEKQISAPHFPFTVPDGLIVRDEEEENLFNLVSQNRMVNLVGIGGSGKSSLAYLSLNKHKDYFNEIAYVVVNNNIKDDFVEQINNTLKLDFKDNPFSETIAYLRENYKSGKQNLLVLDVNETSDPNKNSEIINKIIQNEIILEGWRLLFLSRVIIHNSDKITIFDFNEKNDFKFLKELFLSKAGKKRYNDFEDFERLFEIIYYNPLLAEQLGLYLKIYPKVLTVDEIKVKLYGDYFKGKKVQRFSDDREDETIISFLKNLVNFNDLSNTEKKLLRHFVLWPSNYIIYDVIADLLKDVFESEDELIDTLTSLAERSILTTNEDKTLSYKLHGLLAASLREQIDIPNEDYSKYLDNIERIIGYGYYDFVPYVDYIGNSLCEYDITTDYISLWNVALKYYHTWKGSYSEKLYNKAIIILLNKLSSNKDNLNYQDDLARLYNNLATLQQDHLGDYESAETNYKKAIEIGGQLPKDNPEYQDDLAMWYNNLANLQGDHLGEYPSAKSNYKIAIEIGEQLPKDNPEYQNYLAMAYNNLAILQKDHLGEYPSAESNYQNAIEIREKLPKDNPVYQNDLAWAYNGIADLLKNDYFKGYVSAKENYQKFIKVSEQLPKDNPEYQYTLATAYNNYAYEVLRKERIKDFEAAKEYCNKAIEITKQLSIINPEQYQIHLLNYKHSLAEICFDNNEIETAKSILDEIKPLAEKCLVEKPFDSLTQKVNNVINELLEKCS